MALFQPTNISPSAFGELGNGVVDAADDLTVSWQVNGNSAMTAFAVTIYKNDAASTQVYATGKKTDGCPFYGVDGAGNVQLFSYVISASALAAASGWANGGEYKLVITQYWGTDDSVTQTSASAFITRAAPSLSIDTFQNPVEAISQTFTASYTQAQGDALNWVRWILLSGAGLTLRDTGYIYGTAQLSFSYDGFFAGESYYIRCLVQTENGVVADTGKIAFSVSYETDPVAGEVTVCAVPSVSGVKVTWPAARNIPGEGSGSYSMSGGYITMQDGSTVAWDTDSGEALSLSSPWTIAWRGNAGGMEVGKTQLFNANAGRLVLKPRTLGASEAGLAWGGIYPPSGFHGAATGVAYGNGTFVAIEGYANLSGGKGRMCAVSDDEGKTWRASALPDAASWVGIAYGGGVFVALSTDVMAAYSTDGGETWTGVSIPDTFGRMTSIAYGDGAFVCASVNSNDIIYSTDGGKTWTETTIDVNAGGYTVAYGNGRFVAVNWYGNANAYSTDGGATWTTAANPASGGMGRVCGSDDGFVATDEADPKKLYYSPNGVSWTAATVNSVPTGASLAVAAGDGQFLAWDTSGTDTELLLRSADGTSWSVWSFGAPQRINAMAYGTLCFAAVGQDFALGFPAQGFSLSTSGTDAALPVVAKMDEIVFVCTQAADGALDLYAGCFYGGQSLYTGSALHWSVDAAAAGGAFDIGSLSMTGPQVCDYLLVARGVLDSVHIARFTENPDYRPQFGAGVSFFADFAGNLEAGPLGSSNAVSGVRVYRQREGESTLVQVASLDSAAREMIDCGARSQETVRYFIYSVFGESGTTSALITDYVTPCFWDWTVLACAADDAGQQRPEGIYRFGKNLSSGAIGNNGGAVLMQNFTRYPTVQTTPYNYASGSLSSLIGSIAAGVYSDTRALRDAIYDLVGHAGALYLKNRKGDLWRITIAGAVSMTTKDASREQAQTVSLPWAEIGSAEGDEIVLTDADALWPG